MRIFLTGSTGFIGSKIVPELIEAGHQVLGLARSDAGAHLLASAGAEIHRGDIEDLDSLRSGATGCDGVIHTAFDHNFANFVANCEKDRQAIAVLGAALEGSSRPIVITSSTAMGSAGPGQIACEDYFNATSLNPRVASELAGQALLNRGLNVSVVRLSQIHDTKRQGLITELVTLAIRTGQAAYIDKGLNRWSAAHVSDTARLFRLAIEKQHAGARYHATAESAIEFWRIAQAIGQRLDVPPISLDAKDASGHFGWLAAFADKDMTASSNITQAQLDWHPTGPDLFSDLRHLELQ